MNSDQGKLANAAATAQDVAATREAWVKPEIASFEPVSATQSNTQSFGDALNSLS